MDRDIMQVIFTLAKAGHPELIPEMVERLRHERGYVPGRGAQLHCFSIYCYQSFTKYLVTRKKSIETNVIL